MTRAMNARFKNPCLKPKSALQLGGFSPDESLKRNNIRQLARRVRDENKKRLRERAAIPAGISFVDSPGVTSDISPGVEQQSTGVSLEGSPGVAPQVNNTGVPEVGGSGPGSYPPTNNAGMPVTVGPGPESLDESLVAKVPDSVATPDIFSVNTVDDVAEPIDNIEGNSFYGCGTPKKPFVFNGYESESATNKTADSDVAMSCTIFHPYHQKYPIKTMVLKKVSNKHCEGAVVSFNKNMGWYRVHYTDGDEEDMTEREISLFLLPPHRHKYGNDFYGVDTPDVPFVGDGYNTTRCRDKDIEENSFYGQGTPKKPFVYNCSESESDYDDAMSCTFFEDTDKKEHEQVYAYTKDSRKVVDEENDSAGHTSETDLDEMLLPLTKDEEKQVRRVIYSSGNGKDIIATSETDSVQRDSLSRLKPEVWINDEVIHYFLHMLGKRDQELCKSLNRKRSHFFKSFFITKLLDEEGYCYANVKRWSKRVPGKDIFLLDKIICPVNINNFHWTCAVIFVKEKRIQYYDSMCETGQKTLEGLLQYMVDEYKDKKKKVLDIDEWILVPNQPDTPIQRNGKISSLFVNNIFKSYLTKKTWYPCC